MTENRPIEYFIDYSAHKVDYTWLDIEKSSAESPLNRVIITDN